MLNETIHFLGKEESSGRKSKLKDEEPKAIPAKRKSTAEKKIGFDRGLVPEEILGRFNETSI